LANLAFDTGLDAYAPGIAPIDPTAFGARYVSYYNVARFLGQTDGLDLGLIVWPGGALAETRDDRFGFEHFGLYDPDTGKPDIGEMMEIAGGLGAGLAVTLPTARYHGDIGALEADVAGFMEDLLSGRHGPLPETLIFEIGSEFYAHFGGPDAASDYAAVANAMVVALSAALDDPAVNLIGADLMVAIQAGRTIAEDAELRDALSDEALLRADMIIHHRFPYQPDNADSCLCEMRAILEAWAQDVEALGGETPDFFLSAYNIGSFARNAVLDDWIGEQAVLGNTVTAEDVDLDERSNVDFERYWQHRLSEAAYGPEHATVLLELFSGYSEVGLNGAAAYGIDVVHPGRLSLRDVDGEDRVFTGGGLLEMLYESVGGTIPLLGEGAYDRSSSVTPYAFENDDKLVVFLAAGRDAPGKVTLSLDGLGSDYLEVRADSLTGRTDPDWMRLFGIPDNPSVDESEEAKTYAEALRTPAGSLRTADGVQVTLSEPYQIVRLAFARTEAGAAEIASWSDAAALDLTQPPPLPVPDDEENDGPDDATEADDGGVGMGIALALLLPLLFLMGGGVG
jgi:hypothetical protein